MKKLFFIVAITLISVSGISQIRSYPISKLPSSNKQNQIYYTIPQTELQFEVKVSKIIKNKGPFYQSAYLLGLKDVVTKDETTYSIKDIKIASRPIANPEQQYVLCFDADVNISKSCIGGLKSIYNTKAPRQENPIDITKKEVLEQKQDSKISASIETKLIYEQKMLQRGMLDKATITPEEAIKKINQLREKQIDILSGSLDGTYINTTVDFMYKQLDEIINGYVSLFTGLESEVEETYYFNITPQKPIIVEEDLLIPLMRFSESNGVSSAEIQSEDPKVMVRLHTNNTTKQILKQEESRLSDEKYQKELEKGLGVFYSIPEKVDISVSYKNKIYKNTLNVSQYGIITNMSIQKSSISFDVETGEIKEIF